MKLRTKWKFISIAFLTFLVILPIVGKSSIFGVNLTYTNIFYLWLSFSGITWIIKELYLEGYEIKPISELDKYPSYISNYYRLGIDGHFVIKRRILFEE